MSDADRASRLFNSDGSLASAELKVVNLKPGDHSENSRKWDEVGVWNTRDGLDIKDIVWPGGGHVPPQGVPEKFHIRITFLEEPPFVMTSDPDPVSAKCTLNRGVPCRSG
jgi:ionotropic glutamate receptor NMDA 2B